MRKFIGIPNQFRGLTELPADPAAQMGQQLIFPRLIDNQASSLFLCYRRAEFLFLRLVACLNRFRDWLALADLNLDELVDLHCRDVADFENNFKALKSRGKEVERLPCELHIDCITVNCLPVKTAIEGLLQQLFEALQACLRRSVQADLVATDAFLTGKLA
ncbi:unnamed protein product [Protopolystoma xenopodis]|uniref:Uncharacterized protein n=1 Tax=Protopolystoma xenopodis TaxID=117903 RepID=A0A448WNR5_9PLAT|nr:unnamed protein product [Protopolystoma xenopodis]